MISGRAEIKRQPGGTSLDCDTLHGRRTSLIPEPTGTHLLIRVPKKIRKKGKQTEEESWLTKKGGKRRKELGGEWTDQCLYIYIYIYISRSIGV